MTAHARSTLSLQVADSGEQLDLSAATALVAGYTGRDETAVRHHIAELAAIGVPEPEQVPMFYPVERDTVTTAPTIAVGSDRTSGEVEPLLVRHRGRWYLGVGSDHTDRHLETVDIGKSKRACPKPVGPRVVPVEDWASFDYDVCQARCWVDGKLYQDGALHGLRRPEDLLAILAERGGDNGGDLLCLAGTLPLLDGQFVYGKRWELELILPDGQRLNHTYETGGI